MLLIDEERTPQLMQFELLALNFLEKSPLLCLIEPPELLTLTDWRGGGRHASRHSTSVDELSAVWYFRLLFQWKKIPNCTVMLHISLAHWLSFE